MTTSKLPKPYLSFKEEHTELFEAYERLGAVAAQEGPLDKKTRELIKMGMAAAAGSESAVHSHVHRALKAGATPDEMEHAIVIGVTTMGFPRMMSALTWAKAAIESR